MRVMNFIVPRVDAVMAGLGPAVHALTHGAKDVDARDEPGHDDTDRLAL